MDDERCHEGGVRAIIAFIGLNRETCRVTVQVWRYDTKYVIPRMDEVIHLLLSSF